jgi:hypothetical protein
MNQRIYVVTKDKYLGRKRTLGFFRFQNEDLYYDFGSLKGSHNSYHRDGSEWRTSLATGEVARRQAAHVPLRQITGVYTLGVVMFSKDLIARLPPTKDKYYRDSFYEVDIERLPSDQFNVVIELMEPNFEIATTDAEMAYPPDAVIKEFREARPWLILTLLGHKHNLLVSATETHTTVNHFNNRFTANRNGQSYSSELYAGQAYEAFGKIT